MMKQLAYSLLLLLTGVISMQANYTVSALDKVIEKEFDISSDGTLNIENKYGNVTVTEGNSNRIKIKVTIDIKTNSQSKADEIFDRIDINFTNTPNLVSAVTDIEQKSGWSNWFSWGSGTDFKINYEISMPVSVHLKLANKYGDVYLPDLNNGLDLVMKYGNIIMRSVEGTTNLDLGYGKMDFGDLGDINADIKYSKLDGSSTQDFKITSKYSRIQVGDVAKLRSDSKYDAFEIEQAGEIRNNGKYDSWTIENVENFKSSTKYSGIEIESLSGDLTVDQKYGGIQLGKLICKESNIDIDVEYTDVEIGSSGCGLDIDFEGEYVDFNLPSEMEDRLEKDKEDSWLRDKFGNGEKRLKIKMEHGNLKIR